MIRIFDGAGLKMNNQVDKIFSGAVMDMQRMPAGICQEQTLPHVAQTDPGPLFFRPGLRIFRPRRLTDMQAVMNIEIELSGIKTKA